MNVHGLKFLMFTVVLLGSVSASANPGQCDRHLQSATLNLEVKTEDDLIRRLMTDSVFLNKFKKKRLLNFTASEFKVVTKNMKAELDKVPERLEKANGNIAFYAWLILRAKFLKYKIATSELMLTKNKAIAIAFDFAWIMRAVVQYENKITSEFIQDTYQFEYQSNSISDFISAYLSLRAQRKKAMALSDDYDIMFFPTFVKLSYEQLNYLWGNGILPIGLSADVVGYDGVMSHPLQFAVHDVRHAYDYLRYGTKVKGEGLFQISIPKSLRTELKRTQLATQAIYSQLNQYQINRDFIEFDGGITTRNEIELILFDFSHESYAKLVSGETDIENGVFIKKLKEEGYSDELIGERYISLAESDAQNMSQPIDEFITFYQNHASLQSQKTAVKWIIHQLKTFIQTEHR